MANEIEDLKKKGNEALSKGNTDEAIKFYTEAINFAKVNEILFSNRSAAYCKAGRYNEALFDAEEAIRIRPGWAKGFSRKGAAYAGLKRYEDALKAYDEALKLDPNNQQVKQAIEDIKSEQEGSGEDPKNTFGNPFTDPNLWHKLEANPKTREFLKDPSYRFIIQALQKDPKNISNFLSDPRIMTTFGALLGLSFDVFNGDELKNKMKKDKNNSTNNNNDDDDDDEDSDAGNNDVEMKDEEEERKKKKAEEEKAKSESKSVSKSSGDCLDANKEASKEKELGNAAYKKKDFETALKHYKKAFELEPNNIIYKNNEAAVYFEMKDYDKCVKTCEEAVETGREHRADFKLIAKALARQGNAYQKKNDLKSALVYYNKSLSEHRDPEVIKKAQEVEKTIKEQERLAYINPELSLAEKQKGNEFFTKGDYPSAMTHYTEAIKRNPSDAKLYSNRAACYMKLLEFGMAIRDCDECIRLEPTFVKGYLRKGACYLAMKDTDKALDAYQKALDIEPNCQEALEGYKSCLKESGNNPEAIRKRAMQDPEVQQILGDPAMQLILQQMNKDPKALQEHLKNPEIAKKIEKLLEAGVIGFR